MRIRIKLLNIGDDLFHNFSILFYFKVYFGSPFYQVLSEVYFEKRSTLSSAFWGIFWKKVHFIQSFLRHILERGPFYPVLFKVYFEKFPFHPVIFKVYFGKRSILFSAF